MFNRKFKYPSHSLKRSEARIQYWMEMRKGYLLRFDRELKISLIGRSEPESEWFKVALQQVKERCDYLINVREFDEWSL
jgi:hypothetical protein